MCRVKRARHWQPAAVIVCADPGVYGIKCKPMPAKPNNTTYQHSCDFTDNGLTLVYCLKLNVVWTNESNAESFMLCSLQSLQESYQNNYFIVVKIIGLL